MNHELEYEGTSSKHSACKVYDNQRVFASKVTKSDGPFYCPDLLEELIVRKCVEKADHFAYKARQSPIAKRESQLHKYCQSEILNVLVNKFPNGDWKTERASYTANLEKGYKKVRPDLSGRIDGKDVIIEIQRSSISLAKIKHRTEQYTKRGAYILWIVPLTSELGSETFRPRLFERFLHTMYYGKVYYWHAGDGTVLTPVHFETAERYIESRYWFDENGEEQTAGGHDKPFMRVKQPVFGNAMDITKDFKFEHRSEFELKNHKLSAPACKIYMDNSNPWWK